MVASEPCNRQRRESFGIRLFRFIPVVETRALVKHLVQLLDVHMSLHPIFLTLSLLPERVLSICLAEMASRDNGRRVS